MAKMHRLYRKFKGVTITPIYFSELNVQFFSTSSSWSIWYKSMWLTDLSLNILEAL